MAIIQCPSCGSNISDQAAQCPKCGQTLNGSGQANIPTLKEMEEIKKFNWGAFGLWPFWGFANGMWWLFLVSIAINCIPATGAAAGAQLGMGIYMGMKGGELAWKHKKWRDISHFANVQNNWKIWGIICFAILVILYIIIFAALLAEY